MNKQSPVQIKEAKQALNGLMTSAVSLISQYEDRIGQLEQENKRLGGKSTLQMSAKTDNYASTSYKTPVRSRDMSPQLGRGKAIDLNWNAGSSVVSNFLPIESDIKIRKMSAILPNNRMTNETFNENSEALSPIKRLQSIVIPRNSSAISQRQSHQFPMQLIDDDASPCLTRSRFESQSRVRQNQQSAIVNYLQANRNNLNLTTSRIMELLGKKKAESESPQDNEVQDQSIKKKKKEGEDLNQSLSNLCENLDNSFISRKSRSQRVRKANLEQEKKMQIAKRDEQNQLKNKQTGVKNLLKRLRDNVNANSNVKPEVIKGSKLLSVGDTKGSALKNTSKVLINPVPMDIAKRGSVSQVSRSAVTTNSPNKQPQSILRNSEPQDLKRSKLCRTISGISVIEFKD